MFNYELAQVEMDAELRDVDRARKLHDRLMPQISGGHSLFDAFEAFAEDVREVIPFDGAAIYSDGKYRAIGAVPTEEEFIGLARFLNAAPPGQVYVTDALSARYPRAEDFAGRVAGLLALPISRTPRDYLVLFRQEIAKSVTWAGNPQKPAEPGPNGQRLTPRKSFEAWQDIVRGQCAPWKASERRAADALRITLLEVVLKLSDESNAARQRAQEQQELLIAELNHRVRNILNLIRGLVSQGKHDAGSIDDYQTVLDSRIHALARAHDQLTETDWDWVPLRRLIETEVKAYLAGGTDKVRITGDEIDLTPNAFTTVALVVHELATNSVKYGALGDSSGNVDIAIGLGKVGTATVEWRERGGPVVRAPTHRGFGTTIIERSIPFELKGQADLRYKLAGIEADFLLPAKHVRESLLKAGADNLNAAHDVQKTRIEGNALVVEDNMIIALDASDMLAELGAVSVKTASRSNEAMRILDEGKTDFALLDLNLGDELSFPVLQRCVDEGIEVILATGYGPSAELDSQFATVPTLKKPYTIEHLRAILSGKGSRP